MSLVPKVSHLIHNIRRHGFIFKIKKHLWVGVVILKNIKHSDGNNCTHQHAYITRNHDFKHRQMKNHLQSSDKCNHIIKTARKDRVHCERHYKNYFHAGVCIFTSRFKGPCQQSIWNLSSNLKS